MIKKKKNLEICLITEKTNGINIAVIMHDRGEQALAMGNCDIAKYYFEYAKHYWTTAIALAPSNYIEAQNWLENR